jgi:hypothetical protein
MFWCFLAHLELYTLRILTSLDIRLSHGLYSDTVKELITICVAVFQINCHWSSFIGHSATLSIVALKSVEL